MIYAFLLVVSILLYPICQRKSAEVLSATNQEVGKNRTYSFYFVFISTLIIVLIAFRHLHVGIDTVGYYNSFLQKNAVGLAAALKSVEVEKGYVVLQILVGKFGNFQIFLLIEALIFVVPFSYIVYKESALPWLSYFIFVSFGLFTFSMSGIRQTVAIGCTLISYVFIKKEQPVLFVSFVLLGATMHISALLFLPAYLLNKFKLRKIDLLFFAVGILSVYLFRGPIFNLLNDNARISYEIVATGGSLLFIFLVSTLILCIYYRKNLLKSNEQNKFFFMTLIASVALFPLCNNNPTLFRMLYYYDAFFPILIPNLVMSIKDKGLKRVVLFGYVSVFLYYLAFKSSAISLHVIPYSFFWM